MMLGLSKVSLIKKNIFEYLLGRGTEVSISEIAEFTKVSINTTYKYLAEITIELTEVYQDNELFIKKDNMHKYILIQRENVCLIEYYRKLFEKEISYGLIKSLLLNQSISLSQFCEDKFISQATCRRKIREINDTLVKINVKLEISENKIKFSGDEISIKTVLFLFIWRFYSQISNIEWLENKDLYLSKAKSIAYSLHLSFDINQIETLSIWIYILLERNFDSNNLMTQEKIKEIDKFFVDIPIEGLEEYSLQNQSLLLLILYSSEVFQIEFERNSNSRLNKKIESFYDCWLENFRNFFQIEIPANKLTDIYDRLARFCVSNYIFRLDIAFESMRLVKIDYRKINKNADQFFDKFDRFTEAMINQYPVLATICYFEETSYYLVNFLTSVNNYKKVIRIHLQTELGKNYDITMKSKLVEEFQGKFKIEFVSELQENDLVVTTLMNRLTKRLPKEKIVYISLALTSFDLEMINKTLEDIGS
ncbi:helix-turn-helix domain-containing protein [Enterococcus ureilyticus]|uniref:helix-turn-helix domain-containing protein n=1 Tax=Enterococcus ureilyticus TaxID=1131292 RepID=UPI001A929A53|nr:helix-turn-helix domain-containing protein [Enterococcus ureilyticus]MBO0447050.1 helix-turn-helix domain-containing protein [Enterococcus ureilyticus]